MSTFFFVFAMLRHILTFSLSFHCSLLYERFYEHFLYFCSDLPYVNIFLVYAVICHMWTSSLSLQWSVIYEHLPCLCSDLSYVNIFLLFAVICHMWTFSLSLQWSAICEHLPCLCSDLSYVNICLVYAVICHMWTSSLSMQWSVICEHFLVFAVICHMWVFSLSMQWSVICEYFPCPVNLMLDQELIATENRPTPFETIWLLYTPFKFRQKSRQGKLKKNRREKLSYFCQGTFHWWASIPGNILRLQCTHWLSFPFFCIAPSYVIIFLVYLENSMFLMILFSFDNES